MKRLLALFTLCFATTIFALAPVPSTSVAPSTAAPITTLATSNIPLSQQPQIHAFIKQMVKDYDFQEASLHKLFNRVHLREPVITSLQTPREALNWHDYSTLFVTSKRVEDGTVFWKSHAAALQEAAKEYGVPPEIIVGVLGVETKYGAKQGDYPVIDALATIAFQYPQRSDYFKKELSQFLLLCRENKLDPLSVHGSYAGAFGMPQFMPSSYRHYAIDSTHKGHADLVHEPGDAIASIANYLKSNGWQSNQPVALLASVNGEAYKPLIYPDIHHNTPKPTTTLQDLKQAGVALQQTIDDNDKAMLLQLVTGPEQYEYWVGLNNLFVLMRYNPSVNYAMAVFTLGDLVKEGVERNSSAS